MASRTKLVFPPRAWKLFIGGVGIVAAAACAELALAIAGMFLDLTGGGFKLAAASAMLAGLAGMVSTCAGLMLAKQIKE